MSGAFRTLLGRRRTTEGMPMAAPGVGISGLLGLPEFEKMPLTAVLKGDGII